MPIVTDPPLAITDGVLQPRKRASGRAKAVRSWKRACALEDWSDSDQSEEEEISDTPDYASYDEAGSEAEGPFDFKAQEDLTSTALGSDATPGGPGAGLRDPQGRPLFDLEGLRNTRSAEWEPPTHIAN
ncbi:Hypothetical predicted protein [Pelobates cultripes]|uniref:Uncharacterized protein n=1 Tax=Pelobates cultripes TaxID=61616 RepID=A0AAD1R5I9_PELCU|nr:Hypothetical predicted protein [Pelobates cultripes]